MRAIVLLLNQSAPSLQLARACVGMAIAVGGLAHFVWPQRFERLNKWLGFTRRTRVHVYVNGSIETALGVTLISPRSRKLNAVLSTGYPIYLSANVFRARLNR